MILEFFNNGVIFGCIFVWKLKQIEEFQAIFINVRLGLTITLDATFLGLHLIFVTARPQIHQLSVVTLR